MEPTDYLDATTRLAANGDIYIGDDKVPGIIEAGSIKVTPGGATGEINRLTVTFYVGHVVVEDTLGAPLLEGQTF